MRKRQVHLDFHTHESLKIGKRFSKKQFQEALIQGHVDSITVFSKCHHGWSYHPTTANEMHPGLDFDLLGAQLEACKEINVNAPVYISAGYDEKDYVKHPEWHFVWSTDIDRQEEYENEAHFHLLCFNTDYLKCLCSQIEEVMVKYNPCGIFLDIVSPRVCYCKKCLSDMKLLGLDINKEADRYRFRDITFSKYLFSTNSAVRKYSSTTTIFHNSGHIPKGDYGFIESNTHLELESLPTGGWGYDHFPLSAAYVRNLKNTEFLGMTGKFHQTWGEFGGFKHPNALIYETALSIANGAGCSIGDQLHPSGEMNMATYGLIGKAYAEVEAKEKWIENAKNIADIAVLSEESITGKREALADIGANRMLLEGNFLYNFIDKNMDFNSYKVLILPDISCNDADFIYKLKQYIDKGGKVLATGLALVKDFNFILDFNTEYLGKNDYTPTYMVPDFETVNGKTEYIMKCNSHIIRTKATNIFAYMQNPYFNRTIEHFCSHQHAPNNSEESFPAAVISNNIAYIGWDIFTAYATYGHLCFKEIFNFAMNTLLGNNKTIEIDLPDKAVVTLTKQEAESRRIIHTLFAHTTLRGKNVEVIEDIVPLHNIKCRIRCNKKPSSIKLVPSGTPLAFTYNNLIAEFEIPEIMIHQMIEINE